MSNQISDDPYACNMCGCRVSIREDYCDACARDIGAKPPLISCYHCGDRYEEQQMESIDLSAPDELYPDIKHICSKCWRRYYGEE